MHRFSRKRVAVIWLLLPMALCRALPGQDGGWVAPNPCDPMVWGGLTDLSATAAVPSSCEAAFGSQPALGPAELLGERATAARRVGIGEPLVTTSWLNRPYHVGWWWGGMVGSPLIADRVDRDGGMIGGYRIGWDFDHYWGTEARFGFTYPTIQDMDDSPARRTSAEQYWDVDLLYYPWGDSRWRPFLMAGCGWADYRFFDDQQQGSQETLWNFPLGGGVKCLYRPWLALRLSVVDNLTAGAHDVSTMHNLTVSGDVEVHFGGPRVSYFPYHGSIHLW